MLTVNGTELQKHQLKGPVGYTVVGSPTIVDGVASGFSTTQYVFANSVLDTSQDFEIFTQVKTDNDLGNGLNTVFRGSYGTNPGDSGVAIAISYFSKKLTSYIIDSNGTYIANGAIGQTTFQANTDYIIRFEQKGYTINLYSSSDYGETWVLENTWTSSAKIRNSGQGVSFGGGNHSLTTQYLRGSIDLNNTYIKVNGKLWLYQPAPTKYIVKDGKLVWADPRLALSGPVNYTAVGNPTTVDGVASGFSPSNYLSLINSPSGINSYSYKITPTINSIPSSGFPRIFSFLGQYFEVRPDAGTTATLRFYYPAESGTTGDGYFVSRIELNVPFSIEVNYNGATTSVVVKQNNNVLKEATISPYSWENKIQYIGQGYFPGSIDLNETYIKVNDQLWFYGKNYASKNIAPVPAGYTFGTTTTPSIGYVDMRTQQFTAAPQGATIGRDE